MSATGLDLAAFLAMGFLGSLHCVGMCGGFALAAGGGGGTRLPRALALGGLHVLGKALAYGTLAALAAGGLAWLGAGVPAPALATVRRGAAIAGGLLLFFMGVGMLRGRGRAAFPAPFGGALLARATGPLRRVLAGARSLPPGSRALALGVLNGFVPCGLSWAAILLAAALAPLPAFLGAFAFGLATAPALLAVGLGARAAGGRVPRHAPLLLGVALCVFGGLALWRVAHPPGASGAPGGVGARSGVPECCEGAAATSEARLGRVLVRSGPTTCAQPGPPGSLRPQEAPPAN